MPLPVIDAERETKWTPGPLKVALDGTMTGVWAEVRQECVDPDTGKLWERELCRSNTAYIRRDDAYGTGAGFRPFEEAPDQFTLTEEGEEAIANAHLWAAAPELYAAAVRVMQTKDEYDNYARIEMPARALLPAPDREAGNKAFSDLRAALSKARTGAPE